MEDAPLVLLGPLRAAARRWASAFAEAEAPLLQAKMTGETRQHLLTADVADGKGWLAYGMQERVGSGVD